MLPLRHIHKKKKYFPAKKYELNILDRVMYVVALLGPVMTLPQIYDIWIKRNSSLNVVTWGGYLTIGFMWLFYGLVHKEKMIIFSNMIGIVTTGLVFFGALMYQ